jgi:hypothetical protein
MDVLGPSLRWDDGTPVWTSREARRLPIIFGHRANSESAKAVVTTIRGCVARAAGAYNLHSDRKKI